MGVLLEAGETRIVIDGLHRGGLPEYAAVPARILDPLEQGRPPYGSLTAALTTHRHKDHFDARSVLARLHADRGMIYGGAQETVDSLLSYGGPLPAPERVRAAKVGGGRQQILAPGILALDLPHNPTLSKRVANVGFLVDLGGLRVLHVGDADPTEATFAPHRLSSSGIDVAIVPFWYLTGGDDTVRRLIGARRWVAAHIPPADSSAIRAQVRRVVPAAIVLTSPGEEVSLR
jgi:L-ascorbate metabolism protein UlaG (beta-lactamase superfamily)